MPISSIKESSLDTGLKNNLLNMQDSIGLVQIRQITDGGFAFRGMSAGVSDTFEDTTGISSSANLSFQSATDKFTANDSSIVSGTTTVQTQLGDNASLTGWAGETAYFAFNEVANRIRSGTTGGGSNQRVNLARQVDITGEFDLYFKLYSTSSVNGWVAIYRASDESHIDTDNDLANHYTAGMFSSSSGHWTNGDPAGTVGYMVNIQSSNSYGYNPKGASDTTVPSTGLATVHRLSREAGGAIKWYVDGVLKATSTTSTTAAMRVVIGGAGEGSYLFLEYLRLDTQTPTYKRANTSIITNPTTASEVPTKARVVLIAANNESITLNTELIASVSRDNGTTYTATTLSDQGIYANTGNVRIYTGEASLTSQPSGTIIRTKIETANNKNVEIHAYTTQWRSSV
jgi:hypothetical protein